MNLMQDFGTIKILKIQIIFTILILKFILII